MNKSVCVYRHMLMDAPGEQERQLSIFYVWLLLPVRIENVLRDCCSHPDCKMKLDRSQNPISKKVIGELRMQRNLNKTNRKGWAIPRRKEYHHSFHFWRHGRKREKPAIDGGKEKQAQYVTIFSWPAMEWHDRLESWANPNPSKNPLTCQLFTIALQPSVQG